MLSQKVKSRIFFFILIFLLASLTIFFILRSLDENVVYFFSPSEIYNKSDISYEKKIRVGGLVKIDSIKKNKKSITFTITDNTKEIIVSFEGLLPNLFAEGKGVVAEGRLKDKSYFVADKILAKHDENYMPPEAKDALGNSNN